MLRFRTLFCAIVLYSLIGSEEIMSSAAGAKQSRVADKDSSECASAPESVRESSASSMAARSCGALRAPRKESLSPGMGGDRGACSIVRGEPSSKGWRQTFVLMIAGCVIMCTLSWLAFLALAAGCVVASIAIGLMVVWSACAGVALWASMCSACALCSVFLAATWAIDLVSYVLRTGSDMATVKQSLP